MTPARRAASGAALVAVAALAAGFAPAGATTPGLTFKPNVTVYSGAYGEPGLATSSGDEIFVTTPGGGGAVLGRSLDGGATFEQLKTVTPPSSQQRGVAAGSDSDVAVGRDGRVYVGDLTIDGIEVSRSDDKGATFGLQTFVDTNAAADREWLAVDGTGDEAIVYVAWHELSTGTMLVKRSVDGGKTYDAVPHVVYSQPTTAAESAHNGTSIGQISTDGQGHVYVSYGVTRADTTETTYGTPPISEIHVSVSADHGVTWKDVTVNPGYADANYGNFWMATSVDTGGNVYAVYSGRDHDTTDPQRVYVQESTDHGDTWTAPFAVSPEGGNSLFGWVAGGGPGVADVAWYHTDAASKDAVTDDWVTQVAQVRGLATDHPTVYRGVASDHVNHHGAICTLGIFCGVLPGSASDRSMLDFFKLTVAPDGMAEVVFSDNGDGRKDVTFAKQAGGPSAYATDVAAPPPVAMPPVVRPHPMRPPGSGSGSRLPTTGVDAGALGLVAAGLLVAAGRLRRRLA